MRKKNLFMMVLMIGVLIIASACGNKESSATDDSNSEQGAAATQENSTSETLFGSFYAQTLDGEDITEEIFSEADLTMVNIWGTFCGPCIQEMPDLGELSREYKDQGFQIVGIITDVNQPNDETALQIVDETKADYTHMVASLDLQRGILKYVSAVPTTLFIDKDGNLVGNVYSGSRDKEAWAQIIDEALSEVQ